MREVPPGYGAAPKRRPKMRFVILLIAVIAIVAGAAIALLAFRSTTITVVPRAHAVVFDSTSQFTAYPAESAPMGTLSYTVQTTEFEDSKVVPSAGTVQAEDKASGVIRVYNNYSAQPVRLIKNTRFETPQGLIFRAPADIVVPGKSGSTPGQVDVTVVADQAGEQYNVGPVSKFTVPGLRSTAAMYTGVYAESKAAMTGGFVGQRPGVEPGALEAARSELRANLDAKAKEAISSLSNDSQVAFPELAIITYEDLPQTQETGGGVRVHQKARVQTPVFPSGVFAETVAHTASADAGSSPVRIVSGDNFAAKRAATTTVLGAEELRFTLEGSATIVWVIDEAELTAALAGKGQEAFQAIVKEIPGVQEAKARIEPFWKRSFPADSADIKVKIAEPAESAS